MSATPETSNSTCERTTRYTPAVTIVAAWISADTGVGPAIASGSHTCSGSCADFPIAPANSSSAITVAVVLRQDARRRAEDRLEIQRAELEDQRAMPTSISVSPIRVLMNAFFAASAFAGLVEPEPDQQVRTQPDALPARGTARGSWRPGRASA